MFEGILLKKLKVSTLWTAFNAELSNLIFPLLFIRFALITLPFLFMLNLKLQTRPSWIFIGLRQADCMVWIINELYISTWLCSDSEDIKSSSLKRSSKLTDSIRESNDIDFSGILFWTNDSDDFISWISFFWIIGFELFCLTCSSKTKLTFIGLLNTDLCLDSK